MHPPWRGLSLEMPHDCARLASPELPGSRPLIRQIHQPKKNHHRYRLQECSIHPEQLSKICEMQTNHGQPIEHDQSSASALPTNRRGLACHSRIRSGAAQVALNHNEVPNKAATAFLKALLVVASLFYRNEYRLLVRASATPRPRSVHADTPHRICSCARCIHHRRVVAL